MDQATEWANKVCKLSNGIIGITRNDRARDKCCVTWGECSIISERTKDMIGLHSDESITARRDGLPSQVKQGEEDVVRLLEQFKRFKVFKQINKRDQIQLENTNTVNVDDINNMCLISLTTCDMATDARYRKTCLVLTMEE